MPSTWTNESRPGDGYLLKEDSFYLLLESGDKIIISEGSDWTETSRNTSSWTNESKV